MPGSLDTSGASNGDDDEDAEIDSYKWDPTDLSTYQDPSKLRIPNTGKIQPALLTAAVLLTTGKGEPYQSAEDIYGESLPANHGIEKAIPS